MLEDTTYRSLKNGVGSAGKDQNTWLIRLWFNACCVQSPCQNIELGIESLPFILDLILPEMKKKKMKLKIYTKHTSLRLFMHA